MRSRDFWVVFPPRPPLHGGSSRQGGAAQPPLARLPAHPAPPQPSWHRGQEGTDSQPPKPLCSQGSLPAQGEMAPWFPAKAELGTLTGRATQTFILPGCELSQQKTHRTLGSGNTPGFSNSTAPTPRIVPVAPAQRGASCRHFHLGWDRQTLSQTAAAQGASTPASRPLRTAATTVAELTEQTAAGRGRPERTGGPVEEPHHFAQGLHPRGMAVAP